MFSCQRRRKTIGAGPRRQRQQTQQRQRLRQRQRQKHPACCMLQLQLDGRLARCRSHSARRLVGRPRRERGREGELCALSGRSGSRRPGSHLRAGWCLRQASVPKGCVCVCVWRGPSKTEISLARCRCLLCLLAADDGGGGHMCSGHTHTHPPACNAGAPSPLGCMIGRRAGTV